MVGWLEAASARAQSIKPGVVLAFDFVAHRWESARLHDMLDT